MEYWDQEKLTARMTVLCKYHDITPREKQIAYWVLQGYKAKYIAEKLDIAPRTVAVHLQTIYAKTGTRGGRFSLIRNLDDLLEEPAEGETKK